MGVSNHRGHGARTSRSPHERVKRPSVRDSTSVIDLDRATVEEIEALGVLEPGQARLIVDNRNLLGPFGSMREVERVPYLTRSNLRKLALRVTFSGVPRPKNAVMQMRPPEEPQPGRGRRGVRGDPGERPAR